MAHRTEQNRMIPAFAVRSPTESLAQGKGHTGTARESWGKKFLAQLRPSDGALHAWGPPLAALFISLAILTVPMAATDLGADSSWSGVLEWAHQRGAAFGREVVFTYGPLGYLVAPYTLTQPTVGLLLANAVLCYGTGLGLALLAWRLRLIWGFALLAGFVLETVNADLRADIVIQVGLFCWGLLCFLESGRRLAMCVTALGLFAGFVALTKVLYLFAAGFSVFAILCVLLADRERRLSLLLCGIFSGTLLMGWIACGQQLPDLGLFLVNSFRIAREYDQAAALEGLPALRVWGLLIAFTALSSIVLRAVDALRVSPRTHRWPLMMLLMWVTILVFVVAKHSLVRLDRSHFMGLAVFAPVVALALEAVARRAENLRGPESELTRSSDQVRPLLRRSFLGWRAKPLLLVCRILAVLCVILSLSIVELAFLPGITASCRQVLAQCEYHAQWLFAPTQCRSSLEAELEARRKLAQLPMLRQIISNGTVDVFGSHQAYVLLNGLNYRPRPLFQSYAAYSRGLARLNEEFYLSAASPEYVLFELTSLEHRFPALDDALALRTLLINYQRVAREGHFLLLKRESAKPTKLTLVDQGTLTFTQPINLRQHAGENLWIEIEIKSSLAGRVMQLLYRPSPIRLSVWSDSGEKPKRLERRQAARSVLQSGFVVSPFLLTTDTADEFLSHHTALQPAALSLEPEARKAFLWNDTIRFRLYKIETPIGAAEKRRTEANEGNEGERRRNPDP